MTPLLRQLARWTGGSAVSFAVNLGTAALLHEVFAVRTEVAVAVAYAATWVTNFFLQRYVIFAGGGRDWRKQALQFLGTSVAFRLVEYGLFLLVHTVGGVPYLVAQVLIAAIGFVGKFFFYRTFVFGGEVR